MLICLPFALLATSRQEFTEIDLQTIEDIFKEPTPLSNEERQRRDLDDSKQNIVAPTMDSDSCLLSYCSVLFVLFSILVIVGTIFYFLVLPLLNDSQNKAISNISEILTSTEASPSSTTLTYIEQMTTLPNDLSITTLYPNGSSEITTLYPNGSSEITTLYPNGSSEITTMENMSKLTKDALIQERPTFLTYSPDVMPTTEGLNEGSISHEDLKTIIRNELGELNTSSIVKIMKRYMTKETMAGHFFNFFDLGASNITEKQLKKALSQVIMEYLHDNEETPLHSIRLSDILLPNSSKLKSLPELPAQEVKTMLISLFDSINPFDIHQVQLDEIQEKILDIVRYLGNANILHIPEEFNTSLPNNTIATSDILEQIKILK
ncbi:hypothetical protein NEFER03_1140 [Nematocida sp. LUAm3]|nr:hypothetical protein NEFER03_1140 [Nematocida sp. LUAm3]KAI5176324.1 hypothetical protein NEFER02_2112 [Nematocida sp. LUAm2]KAI5178245.1 hypothetical protein NEFER01_1412 [Nematocida sp. LUAm1]